MKGKITLITGASSGIGKATAETFAKNGFNLILIGRRKNILDTLAKKLKKRFTTKILTIKLDVRVKEDVIDEMEYFIKKKGFLVSFF